MKIKKIAILTSGGDAPGMNSVIFGAFSACQEKNVKLVGVIGGYNGLIDNNFVDINFSMLEGRNNRGGSILKCSRSPRFLKSAYFKKALKNIADNKIDALIIVGGDGTIRGAMELRDAGVKVITLPATIDNDLNFSETIGFDTARNNIVNAIDNIQDCLSSFGYGATIKIMGRTCTDLLDSVAAAIHTDLVVKTKKFDLNDLVKKIKNHTKKQTTPPIVLVLEDIVDCDELALTLQEKCKFQFRAHILGYIQRGGTPSAFDRKYGYTAGQMAVNLIAENKYGFTLGYSDKNLIEKSFEDTIKKI